MIIFKVYFIFRGKKKQNFEDDPQVYPRDPEFTDHGRTFLRQGSFCPGNAWNIRETDTPNASFSSQSGILFVRLGDISFWFAPSLGLSRSGSSSGQMVIWYSSQNFTELLL